MTTPTTQTKASAARDFLVTVAGVDGTWATCSGGDVTGTSGKSWDGGARRPDILPGPVDYTDLVVGRDYKIERDGPVAKRLRQLVNEFETTVKKQPLRKYVRTGEPTTYQVMLTGVSEPGVDSKSGDPTELRLTFAVNGVS